MLKKREKEEYIAGIVFTGTFLVILICSILFYLRLQKDLNQGFTIEITGETGEEADGLTVYMETSQEWINEKNLKSIVMGAQYDGIIVNDFKSDIRDWHLSIKLPAEGKIDSSWNGNYEEREGEIVITPVEYNKVIPAGESETFGFVLYSEEVLNFSEFSFMGYRNVNYWEYEAFWWLLAVTLLWMAFLIGHVVVTFRVRKWKRRREHDLQIISQAMNTFAHLIDAKDQYTRGHSIRVAIYTKEIAKRMKMNEEEIEHLEYMALMHDCGKIGIPDSILNKPDALTNEERKMVEAHTILGSASLEDFTTIKGIRDGALYHHERYDGHGYPKGLKGEEIPLCARIIGIADSFDAMSTNRCYREQLTDKKIMEELVAGAGKQFDPNIVRYMVDMIRDGFVKDVYNRKW